MANWIIPFTTFAGRNMYISIDGRSGSDLTLTPASNPITTTEESDGDLFVPVRLQTGYVRFITDDIDLVREIIPTEGGTRSVILYEVVGSTTSIVWRGFVQPKMLNFNIWRGEQTVAIPIECCLSALKYKTASVTDSYPYMNKLLTMMMGDFYWTYWHFQCSAFVAPDYDANYLWLYKRISAANVGGRTYLDLLKDICTFYGWTCRTHGTNVYFIQHRNLDSNCELSRCDTSVVESINGTREYPTSEDWDEIELVEEAFADANVRLTMQAGVKWVTVRSTLSPYDFEFSLDISTLKQAIYDGTWAPARVTAGNSYYYEETNSLLLDTFYLSSFNAYGELGPITPGQSDLQDRSMLIHVLATNVFSENPYLGWITFMTNDDQALTVGHLRIKFENASAPIEFTIKVGNLWYWWNGNGGNGEWKTTEPTEIYNHISYDPASELGDYANIRIKEAMTDRITIKVYDPTGLTGLSDITFSGISMTFEADEDDVYNSDVEEITHSRSTGAAFADTKVIESRFSLKEGTASKSSTFLMNADLTECEELYDDPSSPEAFNPLERLMESAAEELASVGEVIEANLLEGSLSEEVTPLTNMYISWLSGNYYPIAISREWADDIAKLKLVKR